VEKRADYAEQHFWGAKNMSAHASVLPSSANGDNEPLDPTIRGIDDGPPAGVQRYEDVPGVSGNVLDYDLPKDLHDFLVELDFDGSGDISKAELDGFKGLLHALHEHLDGHPPEDIQEGIRVLGTLLKSKSEDSEEIHYTHMPERVQKVLRKWDEQETGTVKGEMLQKAAVAEEQMANRNLFMKRLICGLVVMVLVLLSAIFPLVFAANEAAKESHVENTGVMKNLEGTIVAVGSSDFEVTSDGKMVIRGGSSRRLSSGTCDGDGNGTCEANAMRAAAAHTGIADFASTLPDDTFQELKSLVLYSSGDEDTKSEMTFIISSFSRLHVRSSKCGTLVYLATPVDNGDSGHFILDDTTLSVDSKLD
jgi:hypothetical protein